jgi:hypothetical protein
LIKKKGSMLRGGADEDEEDDRRRNPISRLIKRTAYNEVLSDFNKAAQSLSKQVVSGGAAAFQD